MKNPGDGVEYQPAGADAAALRCRPPGEAKELTGWIEVELAKRLRSELDL